MQGTARFPMELLVAFTPMTRSVCQQESPFSFLASDMMLSKSSTEPVRVLGTICLLPLNPGVPNGSARRRGLIGYDAETIQRREKVNILDGKFTRQGIVQLAVIFLE